MKKLFVIAWLALASIASAQPPAQPSAERKPMSDTELLREHYFRQEQANLVQREESRRILAELAAMRAELQELRRACR